MPGLSLKDLPDRLRERFSLSAYARFILLFTLFNLMFCVLLLLSIQNVQLREGKRSLEGALSTVEAVAATAEQQITQLRSTLNATPAQIGQAPTSTETNTPTPQPSPLSPTPSAPSPTATFRTPTMAPFTLTPTATPSLPTPTHTALPTPQPSVPPPSRPTNTYTPTPTPTPTPTSTPTLPPPQVFSIFPPSSETGSLVSPVEVWGWGFQTGADAQISNGINTISLQPCTVVSPTLVTGTLDLSTAAGGPWDVVVTNPDTQSGMASNAFTVTIPITYAYGVTANCSAEVSGCSEVTGAPDGNQADISPGGVITLDLGVGNGIRDGRGYDLVFYEWWNTDPPPTGSIYLDWIVIELSEDLNIWYEVFNWGDGYRSPMDDFTNIANFSNDSDGEVDNERILADLLYGNPPTPPYPTGILIDIAFLGGRPDASYRYVRLRCPDGGDDPAQVDGVERLH